jgi:putative Mg2+ transporter-C (MgtC) family protein
VNLETHIFDLIRLLVAALLGGVIGMERETRGRAAGLRTHLLVASGSASIMIVALHLCETLGQSYSASGPVRIDPLNLAAGAITGIGFLGAGVIVKTGGRVHGLTTAASVWVVSAMGLAVGAGWYTMAVGVTAVALGALWGLGKVERYVPTHRFHRLTVTLPVAHADLGQLERILQARGLSVTYACMEFDRMAQRVTYRLRLKQPSEEPATPVTVLAGDLPQALIIRWR